jgi:tRNA A37 methylthiotransferase MiaB
MIIRENRFGSEELYEGQDLEGKIYCTCAACMSVWSDFLSFANAHRGKMTNNLEEANTIVVLGCQVTDLAILNDIEVAYRLHRLTGKDIYMGGCLAQRFDINLPQFIKRLDVVRELNQPINERGLINYEKPFWIKDFEEKEEEYAEGNLFRNMYPLKIGAGCTNKCKYCTIRDTRGDSYELNPYDQIAEFLSHENVVLISDSPTIDQIKKWVEIAQLYNKQISIRNLEPQVAVYCQKELIELSKSGLLKILHCPIQSNSKEVLESMGRNYKLTEIFLELVPQFREYGTKVATNIIIDYVVDNKVVHNCDKEFLDKHFDYWVWNPYFDGNFKMEKAKERFKEYIKEDYKVGYKKVEKY